MVSRIGKIREYVGTLFRIFSFCLLFCATSPKSAASETGSSDEVIAAQSVFVLPLQQPSPRPPSDSRFVHYRKSPYIFDMGILVRGYYLNDQRLQWSGNEETMGAEGILTPSIIIDQRTGGGTWSAHGEFLLQDTINSNLFIGDRGGNAAFRDERASYAGNWDYHAFKIAQLNVRYKNPHFEFRVGKFESPFGNYTMPLMSNNRWDAPFIRTESILWRDTGMLFRFTPSIFDLCVAITNGCEGNDTNSMKAGTGRVGLNLPYATLGISAFWHDGEGSEEQKQFRRHAGADAGIRLGNWVLSSEIIYDEYGMRREFDPNDIFWKKSIYYRQINKADGVPITGWGGYVDLSYHCNSWLFGLNYGEYYPERLRNSEYPQHDVINRRFIVKAGWEFARNVQWYGAFLLETEGYTAQCNRSRRGWAVMSGVKLEI